MQGLAWKDLISPEYVMIFLKGFLMLFLPGIGAGNALDAVGAVELAKWPSGPTMIVAAGLGLMNGIDALRNLRAPVPANGRERRVSPPTPTPTPGG
jgi:hypothetical protein